MTHTPSPGACLARDTTHWCDTHRGHTTTNPHHTCSCGTTWPVDLVTEIGRIVYRDYRTVTDPDRPEIPPEPAIDAATQPGLPRLPGRRRDPRLPRDPGMTRPCPTPRKQGHPTQAEALAHAAALRRKDGFFGGQAYRCTCGMWHVGHRARNYQPRHTRRRRTR
ncbi:MAG: hypothetical protein AAGC63_16125 [Propionicimonas sp.]